MICTKPTSAKNYLQSNAPKTKKTSFDQYQVIVDHTFCAIRMLFYYVITSVKP